MAVHDGAMVALMPTAEDAQRLAVDGGEPADQLHVTLRYLGNGTDFTAEGREFLTSLVRARLAEDESTATTGEAFSVAMFNPAGDEPAIVLGMGGEDLPYLHNSVAAAVKDYCRQTGMSMPDQHQPWAPHITLAYSADMAMAGQCVDRCGPVRFDRVRVAFAGEHVDIPLDDMDGDMPGHDPDDMPDGQEDTDDDRAAFGGTLLTSRSSSMPDEERTIQYGRAFADTTSRNLAEEASGTPIPFVASTTGVQRDGLDLRASGWTLQRFSRNPVFLWCHDQRSEPIGRVQAYPDVDRLRADVVFDQEDERARRIESKYRRGFLHAVSVGWDFVDSAGNAMDWWRMSVEQMRDEAFYDLLELSGVPVPADPSALVMRQRTALRALGRELTSLFDEQENPESDATAPDLRGAVRSELLRIGLDVDSPDVQTQPVSVRVDEQALAAAIRAAFGDLLTLPPTADPVPEHTPDSAAPVAAIDPRAAQDVLAAFTL